MGYGGIGIPMIASSPVRHDSPLNLHALEVTSYQPPWKALSDFALHADLDNNGAINNTPAFQHLVNQASHHHFSYFFSSLFLLENLKPCIFCIMMVCLPSTSLSYPHTFFSCCPCYFRYFSLLFIFVSVRSFWTSFSLCFLDIFSFNIFLVR